MNPVDKTCPTGASRILLGITGASGATLARAVAGQLAAIGAEIDLVVSRAVTCKKGVFPDPAGLNHFCLEQRQNDMPAAK